MIFDEMAVGAPKTNSDCRESPFAPAIMVIRFASFNTHVLFKVEISYNQLKKTLITQR